MQIIQFFEATLVILYRENLWNWIMLYLQFDAWWYDDIYEKHTRSQGISSLSIDLVLSEHSTAYTREVLKLKGNYSSRGFNLPSDVSAICLVNLGPIRY